MQRAETPRVRSGVADAELGPLVAMRAQTFMAVVEVNLRMSVE